MNAMRILALALAFAVPAHAGHLPDPQAAEAAMLESATVMQARGDLAAQGLRSQGLQHGFEEWTVGAELAQRRIQTVPRDNEGEWALSLARAVRLPARAAADRALAGARIAYAEANLGEAVHESGRRLLALWFDWLAEASQATLWEEQFAMAERQLGVVESRIRLGEAPRAERVNAEAALAQVRLQQQQSATRTQQARSRLLAEYPALPVAFDGALPAPQVPQGDADAHADAVLAHNHELARARRHADVLQAETRQLTQRRSADPSVGVFYRNEAGGNERVVGLNLGLTLPGAARRFDEQAAAQSSTTARVAALRIEQRLRTEARADFEAARARAANWQHADQAGQALNEAARLAARAYSLGEGSLDQVLLTQRLALEGRLQARLAQVSALAADARLKLDTHRLWALDVVAETEGQHP
jgi:outer membrane protein TolC